ncbi:BON domain-containing protein [Candidatus Schneideria nysicola]|uniref:BON domain-containing protein n=1 Tax=Candidatus Schneideria nysicola TaxID=1081631 RepID=UPI001CAA72B3|nr:BON domain-containing protein [Candidatus Schneideria nysicola]UAJ66306.1 BON domain-containing protein [Candidatus Schneideria nysicola]
MKYYLLLLINFIVVTLLLGCTHKEIITTTITTRTIIDPRFISKQIDDKILENRILGILFRDKKLNQTTRIVSTVYQGQVLLTGQSPNYELIKRAQNLIFNNYSDVKIYNEIRLNEPITIGQFIKDSWITLKITSIILIKKIHLSTSIKTITEDGEVFLLGLVTESEGNQLVQIVSNVSGIKCVNVAFNYLDITK